MSQINVKVGDFEGTIRKIRDDYFRAEREGADLMITPEAVLPGYPAWDLVKKDYFIHEADAALEVLKQMTVGRKTALLLGHITFNPNNFGKKLLNVASLIENGQVVFRQVKTLLPTYDVFDDARYFESGKTTKILNFRGYRLAVRICEDWWFADQHGGRNIYKRDPTKYFEDKNIDLAISLSVSPYYDGKILLRENIHAERAQALGSAFAYVASVGSIDHVGMDGSSFVLDSNGKTQARLQSFAEDFSLFEISSDSSGDQSGESNGDKSTERNNKKNISLRILYEKHQNPDPAPPRMELIVKALKQGLSDYMKKTGQRKVVFGLSGGLDSGVTAALAVEALGAENVVVLLMPSEFSSDGSIADALQSARNLGLPEKNIIRLPIRRSYEQVIAELKNGLNSVGVDVDKILSQSFVPNENVQARLRMIFELYVANMFPGMVKLNTSNKSEISMGYSSMYGDSTGALAILGDLYKTEVRELGRYLNESRGFEMVPKNTLMKPPSAELRQGQITANEVPPYEFLDPLLRDLNEGDMSPQELRARHTAHLSESWGLQWVNLTLRKYETAEWKRQQLPFTIKVSREAYGIGRRVPITGAKFQNVLEPRSCRWLF